MKLSDLTASTSVRFSLALTGTFLAAYLVAGLFSYRAIHADLENRVIQAVELAAETFENIYQSQGRDQLVAEVNKKAAQVNPDDELFWFGTSAGEAIAGHSLTDPQDLRSGEVGGARISADPDDRYRLEVRDFGSMRLVVARSFEESDEISQAVFASFVSATIFVVLVAGLSGVLLAFYSQKRFGRISKTLQEVSLGNMSSRIEVSKADDDLNQLAKQINDALEQLETTVEGIRQVNINIAHDLRTPLNRLGIHLEGLSDESEGSAQAAEWRAVTAELKLITTTFDSLLRIAEIEAGARKSQFQKVALPDLALALCEAYLPVAEEKGQKLVLDIAEHQSALVLGDRGLLTQLFANLIENAIQHCPPGSSLAITLAADESTVWIEVSDDGPGIPVDERESVTKRFYRLDKSRNTPGSGLGLALVKAIAVLHGAKLVLADKAPGLAVRVYFQRLPPEQPNQGNGEIPIDQQDKPASGISRPQEQT